jgi:replicative DNA helicase
MNRLEQTILRNLMYNEEYTRKVLPFISDSYFSDRMENILYKEIESFVHKYKSLPSKESLIIDLTESKNLTESDLKRTTELVNSLSENKNEVNEMQWLIDQTEKFCQDKAIYNAIMESVQILDDKSSSKSKGSIPQLLSDALGVSFDSHVGHDYLVDYDERFDFYHRKEKRVKFDLDYFNKITKGGVPVKTLNVILAGTGSGKSLFMCHMAASSISQGHNVLYITLEMAEERIAERIDANLLNVSLDDLHVISKADYEKKFSALKNKTQGKLIIKEYPTASANAGHFRSLLNELRLKKNFVPEIIFVDYLNICNSSRMKMGSSINSYTYIKAIAEELRGLAVEFGVPIFSATQTTRSGYSNTDLGLEDTSESFGLPATADFMFALITTEELQQLNQIMVKQLKNRYGDPNFNKKFVIGVDRSKMKLYDVEASAQQDISDSGQNVDTGPINTFGNREKKFNNKFQGIKI